LEGVREELGKEQKGKGGRLGVADGSTETELVKITSCTAVTGE